MSSTTSSGMPSQTNSGNNSSGPTSSPLLFFVALGFGVVFTNLWIIVGVKYCFRYNQRNRAARAAADGEPIDLTAMPRPHRRRREKKLMSMDEVNERFPLQKYKAWKASREDEGLPTAGGISTSSPPSRAASVKEVEGVLAVASDDSGSGTSPRPATAPSPTHEDQNAPSQPLSEQQPASPQKAVESKEKEADKNDNEKAAELAKVETAVSHYAPAKGPTDSHDPEDSDDDDPIRMASAPEMLGEPGDTCAICLDTLEDDDDVRGLACGHAFHASCVDPWLTSRRACCPLCKADYYVPKPRPEGEATADQNGSNRRPATTGVRSPTSPQATWQGHRGNPFSRSRVVFISNSRDGQPGSQGVLTRPGRRNRNAPTDGTAQPAADMQQASSTPWFRRVQLPSAPSMPNWLSRNRNNQATEGAANAPAPTAPVQPTPSQLEAGNR